METVFFGEFDCSGSLSLSSADNSSIVSFFLGRVMSLLSDSALESTALEEDLLSGSLAVVAFSLHPTLGRVDDDSSSDESGSFSSPNDVFVFLNGALDFWNKLKLNVYITR